MELNQVYNMDCLEGIRQIPSKSVKLIVADPPYFLGMTHNGKRGSFVDLDICKPFYRELFGQMKRVLTDDGEVFCFTDWRGYAFYYPLFDAAFSADNLIVWDKHSVPGAKYTFTHEFIMFAGIDKGLVRGGRNVWQIKGFSSGAKFTDGKMVHPAQKPKELIAKIISDGSLEGDTVLDPFMGSGTTAVVAEKLGRNFIGFELDEGHFATCQKRISESRQQQKLFQ